MTQNETDDLTRLAWRLTRIAHDAGREVMTVYGSDFAVDRKDDRSPVTEADRVSERVILAALKEAALDVPVISEEAASAGHWPPVGRRFFLVDPLDGTKEFVRRNGEFTVNIALVVDRVPVIGVVYAPACRRLFVAEEPGHAYEIDPEAASLDRQHARAIHARRAPADGLVVVASRSHRGAETDAFLTSFKVREFVAAGSSLKFCLVACGAADLYPRLGTTMEWDTAAGQAILTAAGGRVTTLDDKPLLYGKKDEGFRNPHFVARGAP